MNRRVVFYFHIFLTLFISFLSFFVKSNSDLSLVKKINNKCLEKSLLSSHNDVYLSFDDEIFINDNIFDFNLYNGYNSIPTITFNGNIRATVTSSIIGCDEIEVVLPNDYGYLEITISFDNSVQFVKEIYSLKINYDEYGISSNSLSSLMCCVSPDYYKINYYFKRNSKLDLYLYKFIWLL